MIIIIKFCVVSVFIVYPLYRFRIVIFSAAGQIPFVWHKIALHFKQSDCDVHVVNASGKMSICIACNCSHDSFTAVFRALRSV